MLRFIVKGEVKMALTIETILKMECFNGCIILAGREGIQRVVSSSTLMEVPDAFKFTRGGELVVTTGYCMKDNPDSIEELILKLNSLGASALCIKLNRYIDKVPDRALDTANRLSFPIIQMPLHVALVDIAYPILSEIINEKGNKLQHSNDILQSFIKLAISGGDTQRIVNSLADILKVDAAFYDIYFEQKYIKSYSEKFYKDITEEKLEDILLKYPSYPIYMDQKIYGYIIISNEVLQKGSAFVYDEVAVEHASTFLKLEIQKKISNRKVEAKYRDEFVMDLIMNNIKTCEEISVRANFYGWDFSGGTISIIVDIDNFKKQYLEVKDHDKQYIIEKNKQIAFESAKKIMKKYFKQVVYTNLSDSFIFLIKPLNDDKSRSHNMLKKICNEVGEIIYNESGYTVTTGIGSYESKAKDIHQSYENAKMAVKLGRTIYKCNAVVFYDELGLYKLLALIYQKEEAKEFYFSNLGKLIDCDRNNNGDLMNTLRYIVESNWNLKVASENMYIHYNTMKYRFNKITELLDIDLGNSENRTNIKISIKLMEMAE